MTASRAPIGALRGRFAGRNFVFFMAKWFVGWMQSFHKEIITKRGDFHGLFYRLFPGLRREKEARFGAQHCSKPSH
jgi:hypothetical protein